MGIAATVWSPRGNQEGDYSVISPVNIVDPTDSTILLIDPTDSTIEIISTTNDFTAKPATTWLDDASA